MNITTRIINEKMLINFDNKKGLSVLICGWMLILCVFLSEIGIFNSDFMTIGPSNHTVFMKTKIDTWRKWIFMCIFTILSSMVHSYICDCIWPFISNTICDHKESVLPYSKNDCMFIIQVYYSYHHVFGTVQMFLVITQVDFLVLRMVSELSISYLTHKKFMENKITMIK